VIHHEMPLHAQFFDTYPVDECHPVDACDHFNEGLEGEHLFHKHRNYALSQIPRYTVMGYSLRAREFRYMEWRSSSSPGSVQDRQLYDFREHEAETRNLADNLRYQPVMERMAQQLDALL